MEVCNPSAEICCCRIHPGLAAFCARSQRALGHDFVRTLREFDNCRYMTSRR